MGLYIYTVIVQCILLLFLCFNFKVSIAAMKSFDSIVDPQSTQILSPRSSISNSTPRGPPKGSQSPEHILPGTQSLTSSPDPAVGILTPDQSAVVWTKAWEAWQSIGIECVCNRLPTTEKLKAILKQQKPDQVDRFFCSFPSQTFLVHLLKIFPLVFTRLKPKFSRKDFQMAARVFQACLLVPVSKDTSPFLVPSSTENLMTAVQKLVVKDFGVIFTNGKIFEGEDSQRSQTMMIFDKKAELVDMKRDIEILTDKELVILYPQVIEDLLTCSSFTSHPPELVRLTQGGVTAKLPLMVVNYVPFGLVSLSVAVQLYRACVAANVHLPPQVSEDFLKVL